LALPLAARGAAFIVTLDRIWDVVVIGAGPAGAVAAHDLARTGAAVLLIDRSTFPRPKVCGGCLNHRALDAIERSGLAPRLVDAGAVSFDTLQLRAGRAQAAVPLPSGVGISRDRLDAVLVEAAEARGTGLLLGARAAAMARDASGLFTITVETSRGSQSRVRCRVVVAATGLGSRFALRHLAGETVAARSRIGASAVLDTAIHAPWHDHAVNMTVGTHGYVGAVRIAGGRWNLAAALDVGAVPRARAIGPVIREILKDGGWDAPPEFDRLAWRGTPQLSRRPRVVAAEGLFAVGDAAGYVEPFTGEGMACALQGGRAVVPFALQAIEGQPGLPEAWGRTLRDDVQRRLALSSVTARLLRHPSLATQITSLLCSWPGLAARPIAWVNRPAAPRGAFV
jgi:menaquinone-9 beta-reductase